MYTGSLPMDSFGSSTVCASTWPACVSCGSEPAPAIDHPCKILPGLKAGVSASSQCSSLYSASQRLCSPMPQLLRARAALMLPCTACAAAPVPAVYPDPCSFEHDSASYHMLECLHYLRLAVPVAQAKWAQGLATECTLCPDQQAADGTGCQASSKQPSHTRSGTWAPHVA